MYSILSPDAFNLDTSNYLNLQAYPEQSFPIGWIDLLPFLKTAENGI